MNTELIKKDSAWIILFLFFISTIFILEGFGMPKGRLLALDLVLIMPFFLFLMDIISGARIRIPALSLIFLLIYLIFTSVSVLLGVSSNSSEIFLYYISLMLIYISVFNHKSLMTAIPPLILILGLSFISYFLLLRFFSGSPLFLYPDNGYQFVFSKFGSHNHLGDFLVLGIIVSIYRYIFQKHKLYLIPAIFFSIFVITSFSRSAYLAFIIGGLLLIWFAVFRKKIKWKSVIFISSISIIFTVSILFFAVVSEARSFPVFKEINIFLEKDLDLKNKTFFSRRNEFAVFALKSLKQNPFTGVGLGNFSKLYSPDPKAPYKYITDSSHNIFLDVLAQSGVLALGFFLIFLAYVLYKASKNIDLIAFLLLCILINFQTDYTHAFFSFYLLFFVLLSLSTSEKAFFPSKIIISFLITLSMALGMGLLL